MKDHTPLKARSQIRHLSKEDIEQYTESILSMSTTEEVVSFVKTQFQTKYNFFMKGTVLKVEILEIVPSFIIFYDRTDKKRPSIIITTALLILIVRLTKLVIILLRGLYDVTNIINKLSQG